MSASQELRPARPSRSARNAALAGGPAEAIRFGSPGRTPEAASALAELRLAQMRANDLQSVCSLAAFHARRADGPASEAGFAGISRRAMALAALYEELLRGGGEDAVNFASYLAALCGLLAAAGSPAGTRLALHDTSGAARGAALVMDGHTASALGTVVAELAAAAAGTGRAGAGPHVLVQLLPGNGNGRGRLAVSVVAMPDGADGQWPKEGCDLRLARSLLAQAGGELDRFVSCTGAGWCVRF